MLIKYVKLVFLNNVIIYLFKFEETIYYILIETFVLVFNQRRVQSMRQK